MARTVADKPGGSPEVTPPQESPSFAAAVEATRTEQTPPQATDTRTATPPAETVDFKNDEAFKKWVSEQPKEAIEEFQNRVVGYIDRNVQEKYGDLMPLIAEIDADPKLRKVVARMTDKEFREFVVGTAADIYERTFTPTDNGGDRAGSPPDALASRVEALETSLQTEATERERVKYETGRSREFQALATEVPALRFAKADAKDPAYRLAQHIVQVAEDRTKTTGKVVSYKDVYDEYVSLSGEEPPRAAPAVSPSGPPASPQAPRSAAESRDRMLHDLKRVGGFHNLAAATAVRR